MFKPIRLYTAICDNCGAHFEDSGCETHKPLFTHDEIVSFDKNDNLAGEWEFIDGKLYCPNCYQATVTNGNLELIPNNADNRL